MSITPREQVKLSELTAISPLDGRYGRITTPLRSYCSEYALIRYRVLVEIRWLQCLAANAAISEIGPFDHPTQDYLNRIIEEFTADEALQVKDIERTTNHDVKAVEYYLRGRLEQYRPLVKAIPFLHFACTSEDINNVAYGLMLKDTRTDILLPTIKVIETDLRRLAHHYADAAMLARTHGQPASPTTMGKEIANVLYRLQRQSSQLQAAEILGKFNGAVGNYNAHVCAYPNTDWQGLTEGFITGLGLTWNARTIQIEPHDYIAELFGALMRINTLLIDYCRDTWSYISIGYFRQKRVDNEVGSSTMPHKVNPIDFENAEGNFGIANAILSHFADKLPISRMQRDLTDSTVLRNIGVGLGHALIGFNALTRGMSKLQLNRDALDQDLCNAWEVLAEPIQTVMRKHGIADSYESLKALTRGQKIDRRALHAFIGELAIPESDKARLKKLTPTTYIGTAAEQARDI